MRVLLLLMLFIYPLHIFSQVIADPALTQIKLTGLNNETVAFSQLPLNGVLKLKIPVFNRNLNNALPAGTCKIKIGLGSKLILDPAFVLSTVNTSNYFQWTAEINSGQIQITGDLVAPLPANFSDTATFNILGNILGSSAVTSNFLVTNHNSTINLSDENPANNTSFLDYVVVVGPVPVKFTDIRAVNKNCSIKVDFDIENQVNVNRYEVQISANQHSFETVGTIAAENINHYSYTFNIQDKYNAPHILIRVKSIDMDGKFDYSVIKQLSGTCQPGLNVYLYPNPVGKGVKQVDVHTDNGLFNGKYIVSLIDITGKIVNVSELQLVNTHKFIYDLNTQIPGQYILKIMKPGTGESAILTFLKF